ncbi:hypothetical protein JZX93_17165 [Acidomonas methanolica]|nr:hypothetical protein [Acidomonas methanolica]
MIVDGMGLPQSIPDFFERNREEIVNFNNGSKYKLWSGDDVRGIIKKYFDKEVLKTFDLLTPYAYKADLARLCVLYVYGGLYIDLGVKLMRRFLLPEGKNIAVYRDLYQEDGWFMMQNGLIFSEKNRIELLHAINWTVQNRFTGYYGKNSLYPTGPVQLGRAVALVAATSGPGGAEDQWIGECRAVTPSDMNKNMIYTDPLGNLTAIRAKIHAGDLAHMGLRGGNNHNKLWQSRRIYGEKSSIWNYDDQQIRLIESNASNGLIVPEDGYYGNITWGPYINLQSGNYKLKIKFGISKFSDLDIVVCSEGGIKEHYRRMISSQDLVDDIVECLFSLQEESDSIEFKLYKLGPFSGGIEMFELEDISLNNIDLIEIKKNNDIGDFYIQYGKMIPKYINLSSNILIDNINVENYLQSFNVFFSTDVLFDELDIHIFHTVKSKKLSVSNYRCSQKDLKKNSDGGYSASINFKPNNGEVISFHLRFTNFSRGDIERAYISDPSKKQIRSQTKDNLG